MTAKHPVQPLIKDSEGTIRCKENSIVIYLTKKHSLQDLADLPFPQEDWEQLVQLIGYSLTGLGELSYITDETYDRITNQEVQ